MERIVNRTLIKKDFYNTLESEFTVHYPESDKATYTSLLNFSDETDKFRQRWYRYKEGYSTKLVKKIIDDYMVETSGVILDPFLGSGSTIMAANELNLKGVGFEVNPFSFFLSSLKLKNYTEDVLLEFRKASTNVLRLNENYFSEYEANLPKLSISNKVFHPEVEPYFMTVKNKIDDYNGNHDVKKLLKLGWLTTLEIVSLYKKAGNGLKKRTSKRTIIDNAFLAEEILKENFLNIERDLITDKVKFDNEIFNDSCLNMESYVDDDSINGVIFSPPYANSFDYTEIYKLELWFGDFVKEYEDLKALRQISVRSHLNAFTNKYIEKKLTLPELEQLLEELKTKELWNKNIPMMLEMYFNQMFELLIKIHKVLKKDGFCSIVIGNSSYGGVVFPTDLFLAKFAQKVGFDVEKIEVDRFIITSSQQYFETIDSKNFLRESIVCLKKK